MENSDGFLDRQWSYSSSKLLATKTTQNSDKTLVEDMCWLLYFVEKFGKHRETKLNNTVWVITAVYVDDIFILGTTTYLI